MKNLSLKAKILLLSGFMSVVAVAIGGASFYYSSLTTKAFTNIVGEDVPAVLAVDRMLLDIRLARIELLQLIIPGTGPSEDAESLKQIKDAWAKYDDDNKAYLNVSADADDNEKKIYQEFVKQVDTVRADFAKALDIFNKNPTEGSDEYKQLDDIVVVQLQRHAIPFREATMALVNLQKGQIAENSKAAFGAASTGKLIMILTTVIGSLAGFAFAWIFSTKLAQVISSIIQSITTSSQQVAQTSTQIASSSGELSQATTEQAASLEETAASLEEISAMIAKASESASTTDQSSSESQNKAEEGRKAVDQMLTSMNEISHSNEEIMIQVNHSNQQMSEITRVIQEIGNKTKVINEIVFQTKLLSFNASVEAARAGEHGKGFAVVAEEVGNLAQMSGNAAKEISEMLDSSIAKVETIVRESKSKVETLVEIGKQKVEQGVYVARQCSGVLDEIVINVTKVTGLAQEISEASKEQAQGVAEINKAMNQLDSVTQQNSATSQQAASASEELSSQATSLKKAIEELAVLIQGGASESALNPAHASEKLQSSLAHAKNLAQVIRLKSKKSSAPYVSRRVPADQQSSHAGLIRMVAGDQAAPSRDSSGFEDS